MHLSNRGKLVAGTRHRPGPELPWLGNEGRLKSIKNWLRTYQGTDLDRLKEGQGQMQKQAPIIRTNWEDYYQVRPTDKTVEARKGSKSTLQNRQGMTSCSGYWARMQYLD